MAHSTEKQMEEKNMSLSDRAEEILESLWIEAVEKSKNEIDISILKNDDSLRSLVSSGHVIVKDNRIHLTPKGKDEGKNCVRRHRLAERLLVDVLDFKQKLIHETSCKFEHLLHKGLDDHICTLLGHPRQCPHGKIIPEGKCCQRTKDELEKVIMPLTGLKTDLTATISYLQTTQTEMLQKIIAMGALPKTKITLVQKFPSYVFQIGKTQFAIDEELAACIYVRRL